ncbi:hypothetical protein ACTVZO_40545 [Streptomyces sp. IBSNAI002]|uniref:hypothetical protein n=1 Tax=Streptomyces sp. IBSNAI002 TaxID=3457500 RepID=UPI003FCF152E
MIDVIDVTDGVLAEDDKATTTVKRPTSDLALGVEAHQLVTASAAEARATASDTAPGRALRIDGSPTVRQVPFDDAADTHQPDPALAVDSAGARSQADAHLPGGPTTARGKASVAEGLSS